MNLIPELPDLKVKKKKKTTTKNNQEATVTIHEKLRVWQNDIHEARNEDNMKDATQRPVVLQHSKSFSGYLISCSPVKNYTKNQTCIGTNLTGT